MIEHFPFAGMELQIVQKLSTRQPSLDSRQMVLQEIAAEKGIAVAAAHPGWVKTDLGTEAAPMEVDEGAATAVELVTLPRERFPHGLLWHKGERLPW